MPAASALRAEKAIAERSRGAHPCVAQLASSSSRYGTAPAILAESCRMKLCLRLGAQGTAHADGEGQEPQARHAGPVGWEAATEK